jgi:hypothetical protein
MSTKPHVIAEFAKHGIDTSKAEPYHGCAFVFPGGRYVAFFKGHEGFQVGKGKSPEGRIVVPVEAAKAWINDGVFPTGTPAKQGYAVKDGVEMGRKSEAAETPVVPASSLDQAQIDKAQLLLRLVEKGFTRDEIMALIKA